MKRYGSLIVAIVMSSFCPNTFPAPETGSQFGRIDCRSSSGFDSVLAFENFCAGHASTRLKCGEKVRVLERVGPWLNVVAADRSEHFVASTSVVDTKGKPFNDEVSVGSIPDCGALWSRIAGKQGPQPLFTPDPGYTDRARAVHLQGIVVVSATIGPDGIVRDAKVEKGLGQGLDEKAIEAIQQWRFRPALEDGKPITKRLRVEVAFRLLK